MRIRTSLFFYTLLAVWVLPGFATPKWWCSASIRTEGNAHYFLLYGRDAWEGDGTVRCTSFGEVREQPIRLGFYSKNTGFGANGISQLTFIVTFWTDREPHSLKLFATLPGLLDGSMVHWQGSVNGTELTASAWNQSSQAIADSLTLGTFDLRAIEKPK